MARCERHLIELRNIPGADDETPACRIAFDLIDDAVNLIDDGTIGATPVSPLRAVDATEVSVSVCPFIPNRDAVFVQVAQVRFAAEKPEQLVDDRFEMELFCGEQRESGSYRTQIEPRLRSENRECSRAGAIHPRLALLEYQPKQIVILAHVVFR